LFCRDAIYTACSATCGGGVCDGTTFCLDNSNNIAADSLCTGTKPANPVNEPCNSQACVFRYNWQPSTYGTCTVSLTNPATCYTSPASSTGVQTRTTTCVDSQNLNQAGGAGDAACAGNIPNLYINCVWRCLVFHFEFFLCF
jgi:hypothetical protein